MTDNDKPKPPLKKKKPPTQTAGVNGIDAHGGMGEAPIEPVKQGIDWQKLINLPAFEMFVFEQLGIHDLGIHDFAARSHWVESRRKAIGDDKLYHLYATWHTDKGLWVNETPQGRVI